MATTPDRRGEAGFAGEFVELTGSLVNGYDPIELLSRVTSVCVDLLPVHAAGVMLADQWGSLGTIASSSEQMHLLELFQLQTHQGPCLDCYLSGEPINAPDLLESEDPRWPEFAGRATEAGFRAVHAVPLRLREDIIGALNLLGAAAQPLSPDHVKIAQSLADVATIAILQERAMRSPELPIEQRLAILNQRVIVEQAKGVIAEQGGHDMAEAFVLLRRYAHQSNQRLTELATAMVQGRVVLPRTDLSAHDTE